LLVICAVAVHAEESDERGLAGVETIEPMFVESAADTEVDAEGFPNRLSKKLIKHTVEPAYHGDRKKPVVYVSPEYAVPKPVDPRRKVPKHPRVFTSHYFSPLPKRVNGKKLRAIRNKQNRKYVPFRATVETPIGHRMHKKGAVAAELVDGRLPNKFDDPRKNMKKTKAPAPAALVEVDAEAAAEA
jgi:hypothetical protein